MRWEDVDWLHNGLTAKIRQPSPTDRDLIMEREGTIVCPNRYRVPYLHCHVADGMNGFDIEPEQEAIVLIKF